MQSARAVSNKIAFSGFCLCLFSEKTLKMTEKNCIYIQYVRQI
jgi:hypothetical protein